MPLTRKLFEHFRGNMTDWRSVAFGGVVVAMVAFLFASLLLKMAVVPIIFYVVNVLLVVGTVSSIYGCYAAWRMGRIL